MQEYAPNRTKMIFTKILLGLVLLSAVAALVLTGNSGVINSATGNATIANIGNREISTTEFGGLYAHALQQNNLNDAMARQMGFPSMVLQREIDRQVMMQAAAKNGIRISNAYVAGQLRQQLDQVQLPGTPQEKLKAVLAQQKLTESELVELLRGDFAGSLLGGVASPADIHVPNALVLAQFRAAKETRVADLIAITPADVKNQQAMADKDIQAYFDEHKEAYRVPETRDVDFLILPQTAFAKDTAIGDDEAKQYYDAHPDQFVGNDRVRLEQVIVDSEDAANKIIAAKPADFGAVGDPSAQKLSADWYGKATLPKEFANALYPARPNGLFGPVKTALGWHVLNVLAYEDAKPQTFAEAGDAVKKTIGAERLDKQMEEFTDSIQDDVANGVSLKDIADKYKQPLVSIKALQTGDATKQLKDVPTPVQQRVLEAGLTTDAGEIGPLLDTTDGEYVLVQVLKINPSMVPDLSAVKPAVTADAQKADRAKNLTALSEKLIGAYDVKDPRKFEKMVGDNALKTTTTKAVSKVDVEKTNGKETAELLFTLSPSNALSYTQNGDTVTLVRLRQVLPSTATPDDKMQKDMADAVKTDMQQELQQEFSQAMQQQINVNVNMSALQSAFGPQQQTAADQDVSAPAN